MDKNMLIIDYLAITTLREKWEKLSHNPKNDNMPHGAKHGTSKQPQIERKKWACAQLP